jgi:serine protease
MSVPRRALRFFAVALLAVILAVTWPTGTPHAQAPVLNLKQQLLAGGTLPINLPAERARLAALPRPRFVPGRILVKMVDGATPAMLASTAARVGAKSTRHPANVDFTVMTLPADADVVAAAAQVATVPGVIYATPDPVAFLTFVPNDPLYQYQWNFHRLGMERAWDINPGASSSIVVAIIDSGMAYLDQGAYRQAPDLAGATFVSPHDFIWDDDTPVDLDGHGTHVAGTAGQRTNNGLGVAGMAFNVAFMPVKAVSGVWDEAMGAPNVGSSVTIAEGIRYAADHGAKIINLSLGFDAEVPSVRDAITYAISKGAFVAAAAGNGGDSGSPPVWPAAYAPSIPGLVAVGAVDYNFNRAFYSNSNDYVEIAAPGGDVDVDLNNDGYADGILQQTLDFDLVDQGIFNQFGYFFLAGTSMATPHVAGLAALLVQQGVTDPKAIEAAIEHFATDVGPAGRDNDTGFGVINPRATLRGLGVSR